MEISATAVKPAKASRRRKIELIDDVRAREITFVKRREGLFRKASELSVLCGAETAVITFSRTGVPFVFSHPSADFVIGRYTGTAPAASTSTLMISAHNDPTLSAHKQQDAEALDRLNAAKRRRVDVDPDRNADAPPSGFWWEDPSVIETTEIDELEFYIERMEELRAMVSKKIEEMTNAVIPVAPDFSSSGSSNAGAIVPIFSPSSDEELTQTLDHDDLWDDLWSDIDHTQSTVESAQPEEEFWDDLWSDIEHTQSTVQPEEDFWEGLC